MRRRLPARVGGGPIWLSPESALRYWTWNVDHPKHSKVLIDVAMRFAKPGGVVWDVGANCGVFSTACAGLVGPTGSVLAIEPDSTTAVVLHHNAAASQASGRAPIEVLECAVSDSLGTAVLSISGLGRASNFLSAAGGRKGSSGVRSARRVVTVTLDWLGQQFPMPSLLKIDVEGAESMVIRGGARVLGEARPVILCEVGKATRGEICDYLLSSRYELFDADDAAMAGDWRSCFNLLAVPAA